jgi:hypothetical protein
VRARVRVVVPASRRLRVVVGVRLLAVRVEVMRHVRVVFIVVECEVGAVEVLGSIEVLLAVAVAIFEVAGGAQVGVASMLQY